MSYQSLMEEESCFEKRQSEFSLERGDVSFYCKTCRQLVEVERLDPNKYLYACNQCGGKDIALGTEASLKEHYRLTQ